MEWEGRPRQGQPLQVTATWPSPQASGFALSRVHISQCFLIACLFPPWELCDMWPVCHLAGRLWQMPLSSPGGCRREGPPRLSTLRILSGSGICDDASFKACLKERRCLHIFIRSPSKKPVFLETSRCFLPAPSEVFAEQCYLPPFCFLHLLLREENQEIVCVSCPPPRPLLLPPPFLNLFPASSYETAAFSHAEKGVSWKEREIRKEQLAGRAGET